MFLASLCVYTLLLAVVAPLAPVVSAATTLQVSQVILPLQCTVDIVNMGLTQDVRLTPAQCSHSAAARQLLADTRAELHIQN